MFRPTTRTTARAVALTLLVSVLACSDADLQSPAEPAAPQEVVIDLTGGQFSFLSPLGPGEKNGVFNPRLSPVVEICRLATTSQPVAATPCESLVAWFGVDGGSGSERVSVDTRKEMYTVVWNLGRYTMPAGYYRLSVRTARSNAVGSLLASADLAVAPSMNAAKALAGPGVYAATSSSDLPVKFRIEEGALCGTSVDCFEGSVGPAGGTFVTWGEFAGVEIPAGALNSTRTLIIERVTEADVGYCLPTREPQFEGCYRYRLEPALLPGETFALEATVGVCLDPAAVSFEDQMILQKWDETDPSTLTTLPRRDVEFLECAGFSLASADAAGTFSSLASAGGRFIGAIVSAFLPQPLYAGTRSPYGGGLNDFSRIGWVRPLSLEIVSGDHQSACAATTLPVDPTVRVTSTITGAPVEGAKVKFSLGAGRGGSLSPIETTSDAAGLASTSWTLGAVAGAEAMLAAGRGTTAWPNYDLVSSTWDTEVFRATATTDCVN